MELQEQMKEARAAWEKAPVHIKLMAGKYMEPVLTVIESLCQRSHSEVGAKTMLATCKGSSCSSGNSGTCMGLGSQQAKWPFPGESHE